MKKHVSGSFKKIGIMGFGEIGKSVAGLYNKSKFQVLTKDLNHDNLIGGLDVLHVAIPFDKNFIKEVVGQIKINNPKFVIIESTVNVGTTQKINKILKKNICVHSPVRGKHPNLLKSLTVFKKFIGADDKKVGAILEKHYKSLGVDAKAFFPSQSTELNKILDTSYYGVCIAFAKEAKRLCDKYKVNYETFKDFNISYNEGYKKMGLTNVARPTLEPPKGGIGGHCVWENAIMFNGEAKSKFLQLIIDLGKDKKAKTLKTKKNI